MLILTVGTESYQTIQELANTYKDADLQRLADYLKPNPNQIKV